MSTCIDGASCQVKVFKPKGADRKHKTDKEKMLKRSPMEQQKYLPSFDCTVFTQCPLDTLFLSGTACGNSSGGGTLLNASNEVTSGSTGSLPAIASNESLGQVSTSENNCNSTSAELNGISNSGMTSVYSPDAGSLAASGNLAGSQEDCKQNVFNNSDGNTTPVNSCTSTTMTTGNAVATTATITPTNCTIQQQSDSSINSSASLGACGSPVEQQQLSMQKRAQSSSLSSRSSTVAAPNINENTCIEIQSQQSPYTNQTPTTSSYVHSVHSTDTVECWQPLLAGLSSEQTSEWLSMNRFEKYAHLFQQFTSSDLLRMSREDLMQMCEMPDAIRLYNRLHARPAGPLLTLYVCLDGQPVFRALYLCSFRLAELRTKLVRLLFDNSVDCELLLQNLHRLMLCGPHEIRVLLTDEVLANLPDESMFVVRLDQGKKNCGCFWFKSKFEFSSFIRIFSYPILDSNGEAFNLILKSYKPL